MIIVTRLPQLLHQLRGLAPYFPMQLRGGAVSGQLGHCCPQSHDVFRNFIRGSVGRCTDLQSLKLLKPVQASFGFFEPVIQCIGSTHLKSSTTSVGWASRLRGNSFRIENTTTLIGCYTDPCRCSAKMSGQVPDCIWSVLMENMGGRSEGSSAFIQRMQPARSRAAGY